MKRLHNPLFITSITLIALSLIVFGPFVGNEFVSLDDSYLIYANAAVKTFSIRNVFHVFTHYDPQLYIPLTFLSFQLSAAIFGMHAIAFHAVNLLLHCANVILVLLIIRRLSGNLFIASVTAALFAIHPIQTEVVLWAAARKDLLSGLFFLLSTLWYLKFREHSLRKKNLYVSVLFYGLGLLSKVSIIMLPVWLLLIDYLHKRPLKKPVFIEKIPYAVLAAVFAVIAVIGKSRILESSGSLTNVLLVFKSAAFYIEKFLWPFGLSVGYPYTGSGSLVADFGLSVLLVSALVCLTIILLYRRNRFAAFGLATYFLLPAPSFTTFWKNGTLFFASDRYVYLASIGFFAFVSVVLNLLKNRMQQRKLSALPLYAVTSVLLIALMVITHAQGAVWADTESLYRNNLRFYPDSVMVETNLGLELQHKGKKTEARQHYLHAIELDPHSVEAYFDLSSLEAEEGKTAEADTLKLRIIDAVAADHLRSPADLRPLLWLVGKLERMGKVDESVRLLRKLIALAPQYPEPHELLAQWYRAKGKDADAKAEFEIAAAQGSKDPKTYYYLVEYYSTGSGTTLQIINALQKGVDLDPGNQAARSKLEELKAVSK